MINFTNFRIVHKNDWYERQVNLIPEISREDLNFIKNLEKYSMCPPAAHWSIIQSINYITKKIYLVILWSVVFLEAVTLF